MTARLSIVLPYFNEQGWIGPTIDSLVRQSEHNFRLILVDNASTDASSEEARRHAAPLGDAVEHVTCSEPGKIHALACGLAHVDTAFVATCDADTFYPTEYVARVLALFGAYPNAVAVMAPGLPAPAGTARAQKYLAHVMRKVCRLPHKCHTGGYGQAFRTDLLRQAGGFDAGRWPYVLEDHEIAFRIMQFGEARYHPDHVCFPSNRRVSRKSVSWTAFERFVYRRTPSGRMNWFFYSFLGPHLGTRNCFGIALREKQWDAPEP